MKFKIDNMPLKEFKKFIKFLFELKDDKLKTNYFYDEGEQIAFMYLNRDDEVMIEILTGFGSKRRLSKDEKIEKAKGIYEKLYYKFKNT